MNRLPAFFATLIAWTCAGCLAGPTTRPAVLEIDASEAPRRIFHSHLVLPVAPGPLILYFPKWLPGTHAPSGAINSVVDLHLSAGGKPIAWKRDHIEMFTFHCVVPPGVDLLDVRMDFVSPVIEAGGFTGKLTTAGTANCAIVNWESMLFYPSGAKPEELLYTARVRLPAGWKFGTALPIDQQSDGVVSFKPAPLVTLIDSPLIAGQYFRKFELGESKGVTHEIDAIAESAAALEMKPQTYTAYKSLILEAHALFASHHYRDYHFLLTLSDPLRAGGWEHHESSDHRAGERMLIDENDRQGSASLLPHEFTHSWNGKYRRPEGLATPGRTWRALEDTAAVAQLTYDSSRDWSSIRRGVDFYNEGALIWLEADTIIRQQTGGQRTLDDFCRSLFGGGSGMPEVKAYGIDEMVSSLDSICHYDWRTFFQDRIDKPTEHAPLGGIENGGWKLVYRDEPNASQKGAESRGRFLDLTYSLGLRASEDGRISDVLPGSAADKAGLAPGMKIVAVNGRKYSERLLREAVKTSPQSHDPIELIAENEQFMKVYRADYHGGARYPHLERVDSKPDLLADIFKAHLPHPATQEAK